MVDLALLHPRARAEIKQLQLIILIKMTNNSCQMLALLNDHQALTLYPTLSNQSTRATISRYPALTKRHQELLLRRSQESRQLLAKLHVNLLPIAVADTLTRVIKRCDLPMIRS